MHSSKVGLILGVIALLINLFLLYVYIDRQGAATFGFLRDLLSSRSSDVANAAQPNQTATRTTHTNHWLFSRLRFLKSTDSWDVEALAGAACGQDSG